ncbi:hypothetical protein ACOME3_005898 [Neoechinorhynchus agilis]
MRSSTKRNSYLLLLKMNRYQKSANNSSIAESKDCDFIRPRRLNDKRRFSDLGENKRFSRTINDVDLLRPKPSNRNLRFCDLNANLPDKTQFSGKSRVYVSSVDSLRHFHIWLMRDFDNNWKSINELRDYFSTKTNRKIVFQKNLRLNSLYVVEFQRVIYRALLEDPFVSQDKVQVSLVDFGQRVQVKVTDIFFCPRRFEKLPYMAYPCALDRDQIPDRCEGRCLNSVLDSKFFEVRMLYVDIKSWIHIVVDLWKVLNDRNDSRVPIRHLLLSALRDDRRIKQRKVSKNQNEDYDRPIFGRKRKYLRKT